LEIEEKQRLSLDAFGRILRCEMLSPNIERRISEINANAEQTQKRIGRRLTLLTIALTVGTFSGVQLPAIAERVTPLNSIWSQMLPFQSVLLGGTQTFFFFLVTFFFFV